MKRSLIVMPAVFFFVALVAGCTVEDRTVVRGERPVDRVEVISPQPSPQHVWVRGRWERRGEGWGWIEGRWERR